MKDRSRGQDRVEDMARGQSRVEGTGQGLKWHVMSGQGKALHERGIGRFSTGQDRGSSTGKAGTGTCAGQEQGHRQGHGGAEKNRAWYGQWHGALGKHGTMQRAMHRAIQETAHGRTRRTL